MLYILNLLVYILIGQSQFQVRGPFSSRRNRFTRPEISSDSRADSVDLSRSHTSTSSRSSVLHGYIWDGVPRRTKFISSDTHEPILRKCKQVLVAVVFAASEPYKEDPWQDLQSKSSFQNLMVEIWNQVGVSIYGEDKWDLIPRSHQPTAEEARKVRYYIFIL